MISAADFPFTKRSYFAQKRVHNDTQQYVLSQSHRKVKSGSTFTATRIVPSIKQENMDDKHNKNPLSNSTTRVKTTRNQTQMIPGKRQSCLIPGQRGQRYSSASGGAFTIRPSTQYSSQPRRNHTANRNVYSYASTDLGKDVRGKTTGSFKEELARHHQYNSSVDLGSTTIGGFNTTGRDVSDGLTAATRYENNLNYKPSNKTSMSNLNFEDQPPMSALSSIIQQR